MTRFYNFTSKKMAALALIGSASTLAACAPPPPPAPPPGPATTMEQYLQNPDVMAAVNVCSYSPAGQAAYVTDVAPTALANIRVTLTDVNGQRRTCTVDTNSKQILSMDLVGRDVDQVFIPAKLSPKEPVGRCVMSKRVLQGGQLQGYLLQRDPNDRECKKVDWLAPLSAPRKGKM